MAKTTTTVAGAVAANVLGLGVVANAAGSRIPITKKLVLWSVLLLQLAFIGCFWLLQMGYKVNQLTAIQADGNSDYMWQEHNKVNFVKQTIKKIIKPNGKIPKSIMRENMNRYERDFYLEKMYRLNRTVAEYEMPLEMANDIYDDGHTLQLWCYREGTLNITQTGNLAIDILELQQQQCTCAPGWHGKDCGQPEIIWRALMTHARNKDGGSAALQLRQASPTTLHRLYYMLELNYINMELLELQMRNVIGVVDYFLIYYVSNNRDDEQVIIKTLERSLDGILVNGNYIFFYCQQWQKTKNKNSSSNGSNKSYSKCSTALAYSQLRHQLIKTTGITINAKDLLLYSNETIIFLPQALKFLKYYATDVMPLCFRLKYNVYGFYWQHPKLTQLSAVISSLIHLHNPQYGRDDPKHLQNKARHRVSFTLGDLNHFGGWLCQYCQQPDDIVSMLQAITIIAAANNNSTLHVNNIRFPNVTRNQHIDANYMQQLIGHGIFVDGETKLARLRRYTDKYYAPQYAETQSAKYAHLLVNLYESLDDVEEDDEM